MVVAFLQFNEGGQPKTAANSSTTSCLVPEQDYYIMTQHIPSSCQVQEVPL
jgi:hypothetical protein